MFGRFDETVQVFFVGLHRLANLFDWFLPALSRRRNYRCESLFVSIGCIQTLLNYGFFVRLKVPNTSQKLPHLRERVLVCPNIFRVLEQNVVSRCTPGLQYLDGGLFCQLCRRSIDIHDAVHDSAHRKQIINSQENNRDKNQSRDGKAIGNSFSQ